MTVKMPDDQTRTARLTFRDALGEVTTAPGPVEWSVSDETIAQITPSADGTTAELKAVKGAGTFQVRASSDTLSGTSDDIEIDPGAAASASVDIDVPMTPQDSPQAARAIHGRHHTGA